MRSEKEWTGRQRRAAIMTSPAEMAVVVAEAKSIIGIVTGLLIGALPNMPSTNIYGRGEWRVVFSDQTISHFIYLFIYFI